MPFIYSVIKLIFQITSNAFYASFDIRGQENIPEEGKPTILLFNHSNSLGDSVIILSKTPRQVSFTAKATAFSKPFFGYFVRGSQAIPVYRKREFGDKAASANNEFYRAVYKALFDGKCIAIAPEGQSKFASFSFKFKDGPGFIAIETILSKRDEGDLTFTIYFQPLVICFTHREKFRSDVLMKYLKPIPINWEYLKSLHPEAKNMKKAEKSEIKKTVAKTLIQDLQDLYQRHVVSAPDWSSINLAITATRLHLPEGTQISLKCYFDLLLGWLEILSARNVTIPKNTEVNWTTRKFTSKQVSDINSLYTQLSNYQILIDKTKVKDERFRRLEHPSATRSLLSTAAKLIYRILIIGGIIPIIAPGLVFWSPVWYIIKRRERQLMERGRTWADSLAENKMMISGVTVVTTVLISLFVSSNYARVFLPSLILLYLWLTLRLYEELVSCARSILGITYLYLLPEEKLKVILSERKKGREALTRCLPLFADDKAKEIQSELGFNVKEREIGINVAVRRGWWILNFNPFRRQKKDWNEMLRLADFCSMDYIE